MFHQKEFHFNERILMIAVSFTNLGFYTYKLKTVNYLLYRHVRTTKFNFMLRQGKLTKMDFVIFFFLNITELSKFNYIKFEFEINFAVHTHTHRVLIERFSLSEYRRSWQFVYRFLILQTSFPCNMLNAMIWPWLTVRSKSIYITGQTILYIKVFKLRF